MQPFGLTKIILNYITNSCIWHKLYNLARYGIQAPWRWHDNVETCSCVIICEIILHLLVTVQEIFLNYITNNCTWHKLYNLARYGLQAPCGWHDSVETCSSVIICEIILHLLVIVQNNGRCMVRSITIKKILLFMPEHEVNIEMNFL